MKLIADVEVSNRLLPSYNIPKRRSQKSTLFLGRSSSSNTEIYILHQSAQNKMGTKYKIKGNVLCIFNKFIASGKASIRFHEPPHDLIIRSEPEPLLRFVNMLKLGISGKANMKSCGVIVPRPFKPLPSKKKTVIDIHSKADYPYLQGFPHTATHITINGIEQTKFDMRILGLSKLEVLNLQHNCLTFLPPELELLTKLRTLIVSNNQLGQGSFYDWSWIQSENLVTSLEELDLSNNELKFLPDRLCALKSLKMLKVNNNNLKKLPEGLGLLCNLRNLSIADNQLNCLPGSIRMLKLWTLDISSNPFSQSPLKIEADGFGVASLTECAARKVVNARLTYSLHDVPQTVWKYLDTAHFCSCDKACFENSVETCDLYSTTYLANELIGCRTLSNILFEESLTVPLQIFLCSKKCFEYRCKRYS